MIDWTQITGFDWGEGNARKSIEKHEVSQAEAEQIFFNQPLLVLPDSKHSLDEARLHALGITDDKRQLHITYTLRTRSAGILIRIISARDMHRKERTKYEQVKKDCKKWDDVLDCMIETFKTAQGISEYNWFYQKSQLFLNNLLLLLLFLSS